MGVCLDHIWFDRRTWLLSMLVPQVPRALTSVQRLLEFAGRQGHIRGGGASLACGINGLISCCDINGLMSESPC